MNKINKFKIAYFVMCFIFCFGLKAADIISCVPICLSAGACYFGCKAYDNSQNVAARTSEIKRRLLALEGSLAWTAREVEKLKKSDGPAMPPQLVTMIRNFESGKAKLI